MRNNGNLLCNALCAPVLCECMGLFSCSEHWACVWEAFSGPANRRQATTIPKRAFDYKLCSQSYTVPAFVIHVVNTEVKHGARTITAYCRYIGMSVKRKCLGHNYVAMLREGIFNDY